MVPDLLYPLERPRAEPLNERSAQGGPVVLPEVQDPAAERRRLGDVERSLLVVDQTFTFRSGIARTYPEERDEERVEVPEQELLEQLAPLECICGGNARLSTVWSEPIALCGAEALQDVVDRRGLVSPGCDEGSDVC